MTRFITARFLCLCFGLFAFCELSSQDTTRVLFIGNSYTYFWNLPQVTQALAHSQGYALITAQSTIGGANLGQHWHSLRGLRSHERLKEQPWDYVVLQDHSLRSIEYPDSLDHYISLWVDEIKSQGAQPLIYLTWARSYHPQKQSIISSAFNRLGEKLDVQVVAAGEAWHKAISLRPDLQLYDPDGSHPAPLGTYLTALAFYREITNQPVTGLPPRLISSDKNGEKLYLMITATTDAIFCQDIIEGMYSLD